MCTPDGTGCALAAPGRGFASVADALGVTGAAARYLNSAAADGLDGPGRAEALEQLGTITSLLGAAANGLMRRFDAADDHDADGHATTAKWLEAKTRLGGRDAKAAVRQMRLLSPPPIARRRDRDRGDHDLVGAGDRRLDRPDRPRRAPVRGRQILVEAAAAGADLDDLKLLAQAAYEAWRAQEPDPEDDPAGRGFGDRSLFLDTTLDDAGHLRGDLTPECSAALAAVLDALGKSRGPQDLRTAQQRYHDALQEACELLIRAKMVPDRAGADTRVDVTIPLRPPRHGRGVGRRGHLAPRPGRRARLPVGQGRRGDQLRRDDRPGRHRLPGLGPDHRDDPPDHRRLRPRRRPGSTSRPGRGPQPLPPEAWEALQYALARRAIRFVSGPGALASALRRSLLDKPLNTKSAILDIGYADTIPDAIRKAVIARDKGCAWPGGCHRRPAHCDVHHVKHKKHGGKTSSTDCVLLCQYHHDICVHRLGWNLELLPDGSTRATSPDGKLVLRSHGPPPGQPSG